MKRLQGNTANTQNDAGRVDVGVAALAPAAAAARTVAAVYDIVCGCVDVWE